MFPWVVVLLGNWQRGSFPMGGLLSSGVVAPGVVVPRVVVVGVVVPGAVVLEPFLCIFHHLQHCWSFRPNPFSLCFALLFNC